jgi:glutamate-1-semialdehyde 2,1-aminomutase
MNSKQLFTQAKRILPGGVNSPVRAFKAVGATPPFIRKGRGSKIYDVRGRAYIDYVLSWGPLILGHADPTVVRAVQKTALKGLSFGAPTPGETELARLVKKLVPSIEMVRFVNSGTEAVMSAIRLARGYTGRDKIIKFQGCYHGHADYLLVAAGSGATTFGTPDSPGVPVNSARDTINLPFNDIGAVKKAIEKFDYDIACVVLEPVAGNMGVILPNPGFLEGLREITEKNEILLVFDEVMTGFRAALGGVQSIYKIKPDLTTLGKVIGGGMPIGAYGGKREIMKKVSPAGPIYQAGTLSGNPISVAAGLATLKKISRPGFFKRIVEKNRILGEGIKSILKKKGLPYQFNSIGTMSGLFFNDRPITNYDQAKQSDLKKFRAFHASMLNKGIYLAPSQFEAGFISSAHTKADIDKTLKAIHGSL